VTKGQKDLISTQTTALDMPGKGLRKAGSGEIEMVRRAQGGDRRAFEALIATHYQRIFRIAYKWLGRREDAEDVAQEVCVKLPAVLKSFDGRSAFSSWLYRVTLNAVRDLQRKQGRSARNTKALAEVIERVVAPAQDKGLEAEQLWDAVRRLPPQQCDAVLLVYGQELSHAEAATIMGCKQNTVAWHIHEAKKTLKKPESGVAI
jgi:RNA polymerase sigma-70 factor, ECF subfamily